MKKITQLCRSALTAATSMAFEILATTNSTLQVSDCMNVATFVQDADFCIQLILHSDTGGSNNACAAARCQAEWIEQKLKNRFTLKRERALAFFHG